MALVHATSQVQPITSHDDLKLQCFFDLFTFFVPSTQITNSTTEPRGTGTESGFKQRRRFGVDTLHQEIVTASNHLAYTTLLYRTLLIVADPVQ